MDIEEITNKKIAETKEKITLLNANAKMAENSRDNYLLQLNKEKSELARLEEMKAECVIKSSTQEDIQKIAKYYGGENQSNKLIEECGELIAAIAKNDNANHVIEEMADVSIVIEQLLYLTKEEKQFQEIKAEKIARQIKRIEKEIDQENTNAGKCPVTCEGSLDIEVDFRDFDFFDKLITIKEVL